MCPLAKVNGGWPFNDAWLRTSLEKARRHATLPQSWIQRENWEFETHSHAGLKQALETWPTARVQRCTAHKGRNLADACPVHARPELRRDYQRLL